MDSTISDELRYACLHNDVEAVRRLCKLNANIEIEDSQCTTPLMLASYYGNYEVVAELISHQNALIEHGDINDVKPIHVACEQQHVEIVTLLLQHNANIHCQTKTGWTPLHFAADACCFEIIKLLLLRGADKHIKDNYNRTPIDIANKNRIADIICLFQLESMNEIKNLISNNAASHHRARSASLSSKHLHNTNQTRRRRNTYSVELEKERIMRGEISTLKGKINELQFENTQLLHRMGSIEEYVQNLSVSVQSIMSASPIHSSMHHNKVPSSSTNAQLAISSSVPRIAVPKSGKSPSSISNRSNKSNAHQRAEPNTASTATSIVVSTVKEHHTNTGNTKKFGKELSPPLLETPMTDLLTPDSVSISPLERDIDAEKLDANRSDIDTRTVGMSVDFDYDLEEDDECKNDRPDMHQLPSLRPEANSLELGADSDFDAMSMSNYRSKASTPNPLPMIASPISDEREAMEPIREETGDDRSNTNLAQYGSAQDLQRRDQDKSSRQQSNLSLHANAMPDNTPGRNTRFSFNTMSSDATPIPSDMAKLAKKFKSVPTVTPNATPYEEIYQTYEYNRYTPIKSPNSDITTPGGLPRGQSMKLPSERHQQHNNANMHYTSQYLKSNFLNQYLNRSFQKGNANGSGTATETETEPETESDRHRSDKFPETDSTQRKSQLVPHIKDDDEGPNYPDLDDRAKQNQYAKLRQQQQAEDTMDEDDGDEGGDEADDDVDEGGHASSATEDVHEVEITEEEYTRLLGIHSKSNKSKLSHSADTLTPSKSAPETAEMLLPSDQLMLNDKKSIPRTVGIIGSIMPEQAPLNDHEVMSVGKRFKASTYSPPQTQKLSKRKSQMMPSIDLHSKPSKARASRHRTQSAHSAETQGRELKSRQRPMQLDNPSSMSLGTKSLSKKTKKRKILLSNHPKNKPANSVFSKQKVQVNVNDEQIFGNDINVTMSVPTPSGYDVNHSPYASQKRTPRQAPPPTKKLYYEADGNEPMQKTYANLRNRRITNLNNNHAGSSGFGKKKKSFKPMSAAVYANEY